MIIFIQYLLFRFTYCHMTRLLFYLGSEFSLQTVAFINNYLFVFHNEKAFSIRVSMATKKLSKLKAYYLSKKSYLKKVDYYSIS